MFIYFSGTAVFVSKGCAAGTVRGAEGILSVPDGKYLGLKLSIRIPVRGGRGVGVEG